MGKRYFSDKLYEFLEDLEEHNDREWFKAHQDDYERHIREPALDFITDFAGPLQSISKHFRADARKVGGSLFRIQRDTRFGADKTPYKTNTGMHFRHELAKDAHAPGFYVHIEPAGSFLGLGLWRPETKVAYRIREQIAAEPTRWRRATRSRRFTDVFTLEGESLVRPPKGFDENHPLIEDLKRKDFVASRSITKRQVLSSTFMDDIAGYFAAGKPFMKFLCEAVGVAF